MRIDLPSQERMDEIAAATPIKIPDLAPGLFEGMIEEITIFTDDFGQPKSDAIGLAVRVAKTENPEHVGKLMQYYLNIRSKKGKPIRQAYMFIKALIPEVASGQGFDPNDLCFTHFRARVEYNGNYWNFKDVEFLKKHEGYGF